MARKNIIKVFSGSVYFILAEWNSFKIFVCCYIGYLPTLRTMLTELSVDSGLIYSRDLLFNSTLTSYHHCLTLSAAPDHSSSLIYWFKIIPPLECRCSTMFRPQHVLYCSLDSVTSYMLIVFTFFHSTSSSSAFAVRGVGNACDKGEEK